jgi:CRP-like cAMP-binding protein
MIAVRDALAAHPFFTGVEPHLVDAVAALASWAEHPAGSWIARAGADADRFHVVVSGRAGIEITAAGREPLVVATVHGGEVIGWSWFVAGHRWHFDVVALDDVRTIAIDAVRLRAACEADSELTNEIARRLINVVASRLEATQHQLVDVYGRAR